MKPKFLIPIILILVSIPLSIAGYSIATRTQTRPPALQAQTAQADAEVKGATTDVTQDACEGKTLAENCTYNLPSGESTYGTCEHVTPDALTCTLLH